MRRPRERMLYPEDYPEAGSGTRLKWTSLDEQVVPEGIQTWQRQGAVWWVVDPGSEAAPTYEIQVTATLTTIAPGVLG